MLKSDFQEKSGLKAIKCSESRRCYKRVRNPEELVERMERIALSGDLRTEEHRITVRELLDEKWESGVENLEISLSGVSAVDFDSLTELLTIRNRFIQAGTAVRLTEIPDHIKQIIELFRVPISGRR
jgi:ABC-type transporter Mla MlaB component